MMALGIIARLYLAAALFLVPAYQVGGGSVIGGGAAVGGLLSSGGGSTPSINNSTLSFGGSSTTSFPVTFSVAANHAIFIGGQLSTPSTVSVSDGVETLTTTIATNYSQSFYSYVCNTGGSVSTITMTYGTAQAFPFVVIWDVTGSATSSCLDKESDGNGSGTSFNSGATGTTTQTNELGLGTVVSNSAGNLQPVASGWSTDQTTTSGGSGISGQHMTLATLSAYTYSGTVNSNQDSSIILAVKHP